MPRSTSKSTARKTGKAALADFAPYPADLPDELLRLKRSFEVLSILTATLSFGAGMAGPTKQRAGRALPSPLPPPCTLQGIQPAVMRILGRPLTVGDLAQIKCIVPDMVSLAWVDRCELEDGSTKDLRAAAGLVEGGDGLRPDPALVIEFADVRAHKRLRTGAHDPPSSSASTGRRRQASPSEIVSSRTHAFRDALVAFWRDAMDERSDPVARLHAAAKQAVPHNPFEATQQQPHNEDDDAEKELSYTGISAPTLIKNLKRQSFYAGQITDASHAVVQGRSARYGTLCDALARSPVWQFLRTALGIDACYAHQAEAINSLALGKHVAIATSTSSGKSLVYQTAVLCAAAQDQRTRAIFMFPTKALAQDQKRALTDVLATIPSLSWLRIDAYDGDTPHGQTRTEIRNTCNIILTNPDMLHISILPNHNLWRNFLVNLKYVVLDEFHTYTGAFGSHCSLVMRRLRRLCAMYGNTDIQFVCCSATITNPKEYMEAFLGFPSSDGGYGGSVDDCIDKSSTPVNSDVVAVVDDASPAGGRHRVIWNPPYKSATDASQGRVSPIDETARILAYLVVQEGARVLCFAKTRRMCELVFAETLTRLKQVSQHDSMVDRVMSYRGGYTAIERRKIESRLFHGDLVAIVATNALELGIDIGALDVVVHVGFPSTMASYHQQLGRAGRRGGEALSLLVADGDNPMDQFYAHHPHELFGVAKFQELHLNLLNEEVLEPQLQCAAAELPLNLSRGDAVWFASVDEGETVDEAAHRLGDLCERYMRWDAVQSAYIPDAKYEGRPASSIPIRSIADEDMFHVVDVTAGNREIEFVETSRVPFTLYEGAILLHRGTKYLVMDVSMERKMARVRPTGVGYITLNCDYTDIDPIETVGSVPVRVSLPDNIKEHSHRNTERLRHEAQVQYGPMRISKTVFGYVRMNPKTKELSDRIEIPRAPPVVRTVHGLWIDLPLHTVTRVQSTDADIEYSIHAVSHLIHSLLPMYLCTDDGMGDTTMVPECKTAVAERARPPRIVLYDTAGGFGTIRKSCVYVPGILVRAMQVVEACPCLDGCVGCVHLLTCRSNNTAIHKKGALAILKDLIGL